MLKAFTIAAIALATAAVIAPARAYDGLALNGSELAGIQLYGPKLAGLSTNGPGLSGQVGALALDKSGLRVVELRRPTAAEGSRAIQVGR